VSASIEDLLQGLTALAESAFPKRCANCGKIYHTVEDYVRETEALAGNKGIKAIDDEEEDENFLELYRNCTCGSTLMDYFQDRRDTTDRGLKRRQAFGQVLDYLIEKGLDPVESRRELMKLIRREPTTFFEDNNIDLTANKHQIS